MKCAIFVFCLLALKSSTSEEAKPEISSPDGRIFNGTPASLGQFPWQAALFFHNATGTNFWLCSGSIISKSWILTAAHCSHEANEVFIYTGIIDISLDNLPTDIAKEFIAHDDYVPQGLANDVSLIKLTKDLEFDENVKSVPLAPEEVKDDTEVTVSGWGQISMNNTGMSPVLNYINLFTISNEECQEEYGNSGIILPGMICAATDPEVVQTPCHGDSGGPVVVDLEKSPRHVAIASFVSTDGCDSGRPSGYTRTSAYLAWIKEKTGI